MTNKSKKFGLVGLLLSAAILTAPIYSEGCGCPDDNYIRGIDGKNYKIYKMGEIYQDNSSSIGVAIVIGGVILGGLIIQYLSKKL